ncbi:cell division protein ZipA [Catenovulum sediminis]|uniref:Cell division protein ZipA n=1 Tax=Catenovulum sediminis TaxID=1740262 RepID=A0ABV1RKH2_9ALTE
MESDLRIVLMVLGVLAIVALVVHGIYTIRKNKQLQAEQPEYENSNEVDDEVISSARVVQKTTPESKPEMQSSAKSVDIKNSIKDKINKIKQTSADNKDAVKNRVEPEIGGEQLQMSLNEIDEDNHDFGDDLFEQISARESEPMDNSEGDSPKTSKQNEDSQRKSAASEPEEVLILNVVAPEGQTMSGAVLLPTLLTLGFKFGEFNIFHRHEDAAGSGEVLFSLANMFNPGTFDIDNIEQFTTQGVSLFLSLPVKGDAQATFNMMHNAAKKIAAEFSGQVLDGQRSVLTRQTVQHYVERIREFERRQLLK